MVTLTNTTRGPNVKRNSPYHASLHPTFTPHNARLENGAIAAHILLFLSSSSTAETKPERRAGNAHSSSTKSHSGHKLQQCPTNKQTLSFQLTPAAARKLHRMVTLLLYGMMVNRTVTLQGIHPTYNNSRPSLASVHESSTHPHAMRSPVLDCRSHRSRTIDHHTLITLPAHHTVAHTLLVASLQPGPQAPAWHSLNSHDCLVLPCTALPAKPPCNSC